jgi:hypothetical protein
MICLDFQPFGIVEDSGFIEYSRALEPKYKFIIPAQQYLSLEVNPSMHEKCAKVITVSIEQATAVALTTDMTNDAYMSVTAHFYFI